MPSIPATATFPERRPCEIGQARAASRSRQANNPASEVIRLPWNSYVRRRSKSTASVPSADPPAGCCIRRQPS
jgi:hypothetical protein